MALHAARTARQGAECVRGPARSRFGEARRAVEVLRSADVSQDLAHAEAVLETRALRLAGRSREADSRWRRYLEARKGAGRKWV